MLALWDGEEPMLLGSTEWAETHADELSRKAVAYLNTDGNGRGRLGASGAPSLARLLSEVARDVPDPETGLSVWKRSHLGEVAGAHDADGRRDARRRSDLNIGPLGSGSDYTAFYHHLGIPSLNLGFGGEDDGGIFHSIYDSFHWFTTFSDTAFVYGQALARTVGLATMRLASAEVLPYEFGRLSERVGTNLKEVQDLQRSVRDSIEEQNQQVEESTFVAMNDPRRPLVAPAPEAVPPFLNFAPLQNGATPAQVSHLAIRDRLRRRVRGRRSEPRPRHPGQSQRPAARRRARDGACRRPAEASVVPPAHLGARMVHGLRRQDDARCARGDRSQALG